MILNFTSGVSDGDTECLNITIMDDNALEGNQTFSVTLTESDNGVNVLTTITTVTITDNDSELDHDNYIIIHSIPFYV